MYEIQYRFSLDVAEKQIKSMMKDLGLPYPFIEHAIHQTLTLTTPEIPSEEAQNELIEKYKEVIKNAELPHVDIENVHYLGIISVKPIPDTSNVSGDGTTSEKGAKS